MPTSISDVFFLKLLTLLGTESFFCERGVFIYERIILFCRKNHKNLICLKKSFL